MLCEIFYYMVFTHFSAGEIWSSICIQDIVKPELHYQISITRFLYQICLTDKPSENTARKTWCFSKTWKMVRLNNWNNCSEMFRKIAIPKFLGEHAWRRLFLPRCAAWSLEHYWRPTSSQIFSCELFEISDNSSLAGWTTVISCLLSHHVHCVPIPHQYK